MKMTQGKGAQPTENSATKMYNGRKKGNRICESCHKKVTMIFVEVVLRHFHRSRYRSSTVVVLLLEGLRSHEELAIREYGGHEDLRGSGHRSVIPYVHR
jgi:hypothetical protein